VKNSHKKSVDFISKTSIIGTVDREIVMNIVDSLIDEFRQFCFENQLPLMSADELLVVGGLEPEQVEFLQDFIVRWEEVV
jgi:hypothetical protein